MDNQYTGTPLESDWERLQRKRAINKALLEQSLAPYKGTENIGSGRFNFAVDNRLGEGISKIGNALLARYGNKQADEEAAALSDKYNTGRQAAVDALTAKLQGAPEKEYQLSPDEQFDNEQIPGLKTAAVAPDREGALMMATTDPYLQNTKVADAIMDSQPKAQTQTYKIIQEGAGDGFVRDVEVVNGRRTRYLTEPYRKSMPSTKVTQTVNNAPGVTNEGTKKYWSGIGEAAIELKKSADLARNQNFELDRMKLAIARGAESGFGQETLLQMKSLGKTLGLEMGDLEKMGEQEVILSVGNKLALLVRNPDSGMGLPGAASNQDLVFLKGAVPGLGKTKQGNLLLVDIAQRMNNLKIATAEYSTNLINENNGVLPKDFELQMQKFVSDYDVLSDAERDEIKVLTSDVEPSNVDIPPAPEGIDPEDWKYMDEADRALFSTGN